MKKNRRVLVRALLATASLLAPAMARAQEGPSGRLPEDGIELARAGSTAPPAARDGEVVVTARRRAENIRDVPISVQAISGETLERKGTIDLQSLIDQTPGLNSTGGNPRNFSVTIRGIGYAPTAADGLDNAIGVYFDGVYQARPGQVLQDLVDVQSFEVLRGPQGTLFGRNAAAGALNITFNKPSFTSGQTVELTYGRYDFAQAKAIVTGPITDNLAFRTVAFGTRADGWIATPFRPAFKAAAERQGIDAPTATAEGTTAGTKRWGVRQQFLLTAGDLTLNLAGDLNVENDSAAGFSSGGGIIELFGPGNWGINATAAQRTRVSNAFAALGRLADFGGVQNWAPAVDPRTSIINNYNRTKTKNAGVSLTADYDYGWATLTSITAWRLWTFDPPQDSDTSPLDIYQNMAISHSDQFSQEVRLASSRRGPLEWQAGVFLYHSKLKDHYVVHQFGADVIPWYNAFNTVAGANFTPIPLSFRSQLTGVQIIEDTTVKNRTAAAYGQATWHATDRLDVTGGLRYTYDRKNGSSPVDASQMPATLPAGITNAQLLAFYTAIDAVQRNPGVTYRIPGYPTAAATSGYPLNLETSNDNLSGTLSLSYKIAPDVTGYVTYATGFQAGGLDLNNRSLSPSAPAIQPTTTKNIEVGLKASLLDRHLTLSLAVYQEQLNGFQTSISFVLPDGTPQRGATNVGDIRARGLEWSVAANVGGGFRLTFDGNYNDANYTRAPSLPAPAELSYNGIANIDAEGQRAPYSPRWALSATPSWDVQVASGTEFYSYAQFSHTTGYGTGVTQSIYTQVPNQSNLNLRAGLRLNSGRYDISLFANNATNERNIISQALLAAPSGAGVTAYLGRTVNYNQPARYGITLRARY
ncbi:TonB-dependent receptor [Sphingomonas sp. BK345]|uniref:TonB-dependent receptor n=1 Tax=Sphingomonas sp. BK345 TaxID=2586980 RepID=UPI001618572B|nr:TonB-dependent receptor [Sphingomonas sp. BK345]MBB3475201.1 iron complex outermembrane receptor protein [Sphingomonas sp. BK345]